jgi:hypothetical protein
MRIEIVMHFDDGSSGRVELDNITTLRLNNGIREKTTTPNDWREFELDGKVEITIAGERVANASSSESSSSSLPKP